MENELWFIIFGWIGSILVVWSLMVSRVLRFRWMNFAGAFIATIYNGVIQLWPFFAMNLAITIIDAYWIYKLTHERHDDGRRCRHQADHEEQHTENRSPPRVPVAPQQLRIATPCVFHPRGRLLVGQSEPGPQPVE